MKAKLKIKTNPRKMRKFKAPALNFEHNKNKDSYREILKFSKIFSNKFTSRELEVLFFLRRNLKNREIADIICISEKTIKFHLTKIFKMTGTKNRKDLLFWLFSIESAQQKAEPIINTETTAQQDAEILPRQKI